MPDAYIIGLFPRSEKLISTWKAFDRGDVGERELSNVYIEHVKNVYNLQVRQGFKYIHDPQSNWHDLFRPFTNMAGIEAGPLKRFYENNTFFREPRVYDPKFDGNVLDGYISRRVAPFTSISIPGPYTFTRLSRLEAEENRVGEFISDTIKYLLKAGYSRIFLHEPELVYGEVDRDLFKELYRLLLNYRDSIVIHLYYGDASKVSDLIEGLGVEYTIDLAYTLLEGLKNLRSRIIGGVAGDNTLLEDPVEVVNKISSLVGEDFILVNNVDLDFLPYEYAVKKVELLGMARGVE